MFEGARLKLKNDGCCNNRAEVISKKKHFLKYINQLSKESLEISAHALFLVFEYIGNRLVIECSDNRRNNTIL
ncbi:hypothetical protein PPL_02440 [Heterostelium album PN500]|uniref:Uncharacterized protein n=1 Tax=Heterostelium pallidum (strain ATCC 26659 / Pp 5 / PN500) TaxID=670386 RepID=D3AZQ6_HETP5|nr:hypothetical protein PPL_02440 [Heterostelium album PN500]EFA85435.1 hypothetical protein PPL_02440 [Heterostelium album PN500]|eukprot:XP_020437544.1 hypothetical protein PPL_02440 [Heterostelium album PN500]